jgi:hypothetical protein
LRRIEGVIYPESLRSKEESIDEEDFDDFSALLEM